MKILPIAVPLLALLVPLPAAETRAQKPNIVFILVDDMPYAGPSANGNPVLQTPHIDRITREGMIFSRASTGPLC